MISLNADLLENSDGITPPNLAIELDHPHLLYTFLESDFINMTHIIEFLKRKIGKDETLDNFDSFSFFLSENVLIYLIYIFIYLGNRSISRICIPNI